MSSLEQRTNFKFCVLLEKSPSETLEMLKKAYGNDAMNKTGVYEWHKGKVGTTQSDVGGEIRRKRPEKWAANDWFLLHDNAPPHRALIVKNYLATHRVTTLEHPPYSPDLAPTDFYLFPRLKMKLKGHRFVDSDEVIENGFQECIEQLYEG
ncbi:hypothetical protein AVEN_190319-1 [Araneus ventricosus]|uniref:Mariner Mos1 transposase n=1 Tax=Araneus ventricosus TaxID=182803 RepID=A0A4Y2VWL3_ARAVE|nr:hypothetical protein AVEN_163764-1 [Araneus ventricosus]GBO28614.1 hypothetical protein AVEN_98746-1 [Araneus ventricosus]GBO28666.1 hypothetical protein AVEN_190319-1 [Araneus ventricosus]